MIGIICETCEGQKELLDECPHCLFIQNEEKRSKREPLVMKTHCLKGHLFDEKNCRINPYAKRQSHYQICRICLAEKARHYSALRRARNA